ncbi:MAG TPA: hypothetical protein VJP02_26930 [Candidatus Sulfotelmatobacter sp.]|nr:hypothetical protein [Candidatus Sulfotelmatobacter sp.]
MLHATPKFNAVPNLVEGFTVDRSELETLAIQYFTDQITYHYEQWAHDYEFAVTTCEYADYARATARLEAIAAVLGDDSMNRLSNKADETFKREVGEQNWADFNAPRK